MAEFVEFMKGALSFGGGLLALLLAWQVIETVTALGAKWASQAAEHEARAELIAAEEEALRQREGI